MDNANSSTNGQNGDHKNSSTPVGHNNRGTGSGMMGVGQNSSFLRPEKSSFKRRPTIERVQKHDSVLSETSPSDRTLESIKFPRMKRFTHFHYDFVEFSSIKCAIDANSDEEEHYCVRVTVNKKMWMVRRGYEHFCILDRQLHICVFDRRISQLPNLEEFTAGCVEEMNKIIMEYVERLCDQLDDIQIYCGTVLNFFEVDNRGNKLISADDAAINIPAIAAARTTKAYDSQAPDELSLKVGDMVSVIDKPQPGESMWWRGKKGFEVGFFPSECVEIIGAKMQSIPVSENIETKPVLRRRGKLITFLRMFFTNRPARTTLKQNGIVKERVFGCDLGEHLSNTKLIVPLVLQCCCDSIEQHGLIDGIYRLTGVASNIQKLRSEFDEGAIETLEDEQHLLDLHTITAVLKMYFRELPNPLMTYQLYESFSEAVQLKGDERLEKLRSVVARLPPPHYRTAKRLFRHLNQMSQFQSKTGMDSRNLAIVWSPNLMRCKAMEGGNVTGATMLHNVSIQATVVEALISHYDFIFTEDPQADDQSGWGSDFCSDADSVDGETRLSVEHDYENISPPHKTTRNPTIIVTPADSHVNKKPRPTSVAVTTPSRLLSLTEAQDRLSGEGSTYDINAEVNDEIIPVFHTIIDFSDRRKAGSMRETSSGATDPHLGPPISKDRAGSGWRSFFNRGRQSSVNKKTAVEADVDHTTPVVDVERSKSEDSTTEITENEIGHLSRQLLVNTNPVLLSQANLQGSMPSLIDRTGSTNNLEDVEAIPVNVDENTNNLARASSHESFFEPQSPANNLFDEPLVTSSQPKTPGVVFRPAYKQQDIGELLNANIPKATWKTSSNPRPKNGSSTLEYHHQQQQSKASRLPHLSSAVSVPNDEVKSISEEHSPGSLRRNQQVSAAKTSGSQQVLYDDSHIYETIEIPKRNKSTKPPIPRSSQTEQVQQEPKHPPASSTPMKDQLQLQIDLADSTTSDMDKLMAGWQDSETMMCMNQAQQARLSRHFSIQSSSSDRSNRRLLVDLSSPDMNSDTTSIREEETPTSPGVISPISDPVLSFAIKPEDESLAYQKQPEQEVQMSIVPILTVCEEKPHQDDNNKVLPIDQAEQPEQGPTIDDNQIDSHVYANIDPLGINTDFWEPRYQSNPQLHESRSMASARRLEQNHSPEQSQHLTDGSIKGSFSSLVSHESQDNQSQSFYAAKYLQDRPRQTSVPKQIYTRLSQDGDQNIRPRANTSPYTNSASVRNRRKETDVDEALANQNFMHQLPAQNNKITRNNDYVNINSYKRYKERKLSSSNTSSEASVSGNNTFVTSQSDITSTQAIGSAGSDYMNIPFTESTIAENSPNKNKKAATTESANSYVPVVTLAERADNSRPTPPQRVPKSPPPCIPAKPSMIPDYIRACSVSPARSTTSSEGSITHTEHHARLDVTISHDITRTSPSSANHQVNNRPEPVPRKHVPVLDLL